MTVFDISTGDDWYGVIILGIEHASLTLTVIYCFLIFYVVNYFVFGIIIAVILDEFSDAYLELNQN